MIKKEYKHSDITKKIIGCAMKVYSTLRNGFQEVIYRSRPISESACPVKSHYISQGCAAQAERNE